MKLRGILETVIYCEPGERQGVESFYSGTLGLAEVARWDDGTAFRVGDGVLLLFDRAKLAERTSPISDPGASGPGHVCFLVAEEDYAGWSERLRDGGIDLIHEQEWREGRHSFYFRDPAGNLLEVAGGDIWPR